MRSQCIGCVQKHLGSAAVYEHEIRHGYPHYGPYMWGELVHAEQEIEAVSHAFASVLREHRVKAQYGDGHSIPFDALIEFTYALMGMENDGEDTQKLEVSAGCLEGLEKDEKGYMVESGDTRT